MTLRAIEIGAPRNNYGVTVLRIVGDGGDVLEVAGTIEFEIVLRACKIALGRDREHQLGGIEGEDILFVVEELPPRPLKKKPTRRRETTSETAV